MGDRPETSIPETGVETRAASVRVPKLHHVNLKTRRLDEAIAWYERVAGLEVYYRYEWGAWLSNDCANHRLAFLTTPLLRDDPDKLAHTSMHHLAFEYADLDELLDSYARLKGDGILPHMCVDHGMTISFYYVDPDGNSVELQADNFGDWSLSSDFVRHAPEFAADPVGPAVDPEQLLAARAHGASADEIHRRAYAGEFSPAKPWDPRLPF